MRLNELELFKEKPKVKKEKIYRKEMSRNIGPDYQQLTIKLYFRNIKATN